MIMLKRLIALISLVGLYLMPQVTLGNAFKPHPQRISADSQVKGSRPHDGVNDMDKIIYVSATLDCDVNRAFEMFTVKERIQSWLAPLAYVEPVINGKYELFFDPADPENNSTIGCKITAIAPGKLLCFEWKGPKQFKHFMNQADPLTHVVVSFMPCDKASTPCTEVHLIHSGWRKSSEWEEAREWFNKAWTVAFEQLKKQVNK